MLVANGSWFLRAFKLICRSWFERILAAAADAAVAGDVVPDGLVGTLVIVLLELELDDLLLLVVAIVDVAVVVVFPVLLVRLVLRLRIFIVLRLLKTIYTQRESSRMNERMNGRRVKILAQL